MNAIVIGCPTSEINFNLQENKVEMHNLAKTSLVAKRFSADFSDITLTQLNSSDPLVINGVGTISQDEFGALKLKIFQKTPLNIEKVLSYHAEKSSGKFSFAGACNLHATEYGGGTWTCAYLRTNETLTIEKEGCTGVFSAAVGQLENVRGVPVCFQKSTFEGVIPFDLDLPFNLGADGKKNSYPERMLRFSFNKSTKIELSRGDGYTTVRIDNNFELVSECFIEALTQALSIASGRAIKYIWRKIIGEQFTHNRISDFDFENSRNLLHAPFNAHSGADFLRFIDAYVKYSLRNEHNYFGYWEKLHASWASGLAVAALPLSVYIEGVMKEFYPNLMRSDPKLEADIALTVDAIEKLEDIEPDVKKRVRARIQGAARGNVANALRALVEKNHIGDNLVKSWQTVRNRSAHGADFTQIQVKKTQEIVTAIFSCLHLFYVLLYLKLEFSGTVIDFSIIGFPAKLRGAYIQN